MRILDKWQTMSQEEILNAVPLMAMEASNQLRLYNTRQSRDEQSRKLLNAAADTLFDCLVALTELSSKYEARIQDAENTIRDLTARAEDAESALHALQGHDPMDV